MLTLPKTILFDLDDTLLAWSETILSAWESLCSRHADRLGDTSDLPQAILDVASRLYKNPDQSPRICLEMRFYWCFTTVESKRNRSQMKWPAHI
jgi:phosphoglycolate phosphatase-like HAD superfamily hydrolase